MDLWMMAANLLGMAVARAAGHFSDRGVDAAADKAMDGFLRLVKGKSPQAVAELESQGPTPVAKGVAGRLMEIEIQRDPAFAAAVAEYVEELKRLGIDRALTPGMSMMA